MLTVILVSLALLFGLAFAIQFKRRGNSGAASSHGPARGADQAASRSAYEHAPRYTGDGNSGVGS